MELYQLEQFIAIAECGSMGEAAKRLYLSRAALSQNLKRLEQELGCELFNRKHNKLAITPYGEILLERARRVMGEISDALEQIEEEKRAQDKVIRVGHFSMPLCYFKMPHVAHVLPEWTFLVDIRGAQAICEGLAEGEYDMVFVTSDAPIPPDALILPLEPERACLSVPVTSALYDRQEVSLAEVAGEKLLIADDLAGASLWYRQLVAASGINPENVTSIPAEEYLSTMSGSDKCHFSTLQMVDFFGLGNGRRAVMITDDIARRDIVAVCMKSKSEALADVLSCLRANKQERFGSYDIFPYLLFPGKAPNLQINATS